VERRPHRQGTNFKSNKKTKIDFYFKAQKKKIYLALAQNVINQKIYFQPTSESFSCQTDCKQARYDWLHGFCTGWRGDDVAAPRVRGDL
jgi:hypothetical protein